MMSARPRPVTATFKPKSMIPPVGVRTRSYSLSSGGSTESLVSVLDHDSVGELELSDPEPETKSVPKQETSHKIQKKRYTKHTHVSVEKGMRRHKACKEPVETGKLSQGSPESEMTEDTVDVNGVESDQNGLGPWENWLLHKAKEEQEKLKAEIRKKKKELQEKQQMEEEKKVKQKKGEEKYKEWLEKKSAQARAKDNQEKHLEKVQAELKEKEKKVVEEKSKKKLEEWLSQKKNQEKEQKRKKQEEKDRKEREKEEIQQKSAVAYENWLHKVQNRPRSSQHHTSFGYTSGKLTGYYDTNAYPVPTFCNPIPWQPVEVPRPKSERTKRAKTKNKWNPNKYL